MQKTNRRLVGVPMKTNRRLVGVPVKTNRRLVGVPMKTNRRLVGMKTKATIIGFTVLTLSLLGAAPASADDYVIIEETERSWPAAPCPARCSELGPRELESEIPKQLDVIPDDDEMGTPERFRRHRFRPAIPRSELQIPKAEIPLPPAAVPLPRAAVPLPKARLPKASLPKAQLPKPSPAPRALPAPTTRSTVLKPQEARVFVLLNNRRRAQGLRPLRLDPAATRVARLHSRDMCKRRYFDHRSPEGSTPWARLRRGKVRFSSAAENIAVGQRSALEVHQSWMKSSGHRKNRMNSRYRRVGVGLFYCGQVPYWTEVFMS